MNKNFSIVLLNNNDIGFINKDNPNIFISYITYQSITLTNKDSYRYANKEDFIQYKIKDIYDKNFYNEIIYERKYNYSVSGNISTSFDNGTVIALNEIEAKQKAIQLLDKDFKIANEALSKVGMNIDYDSISIIKD